MKPQTVLPIHEDLAQALESGWPDPLRGAAFGTDAHRAQLSRPRPGEDQGDLAIINAHTDDLEAEATDVLAYQIVP